jgi:cytochrome c-type biogenesis protein CcmH/NrfG
MYRAPAHLPEIRHTNAPFKETRELPAGIRLGVWVREEFFMRTQSENVFSPMNAITGIAGILFGVIVGYVIGSGQLQGPALTAAAAPAASSAAQSTTLVTDADLQPFRDILARDPKNAGTAAALANKLYDAGRYSEAIPYYQQALTNDPKNVNVSTDLGTAMFYAGRADEALVQLQKSLAIDPNHAQTLFNIGIVKRDGKNDKKGAVEAWERLLASSPGYPEAARVRLLINESK